MLGLNKQEIRDTIIRDMQMPPTEELRTVSQWLASAIGVAVEKNNEAIERQLGLSS